MFVICCSFLRLLGVSFEKVIQNGGLKACKILLSTNFDILHMEALRFLSLLVGMQKSDYFNKMYQAELVQDLIRVLPISTNNDVKNFILNILRQSKVNNGMLNNNCKDFCVNH